MGMESSTYLGFNMIGSTQSTMTESANGNALAVTGGGVDGQKESLKLVSANRDTGGEMVETISCAAIRLEDGTVESLPRPYRHTDIYLKITSSDRPRAINTYGFLTSDGRFVNRREAYLIAIVAGQTTGAELFTEDLW